MFVFLLLNCKDSLYILDTGWLLSDIWFSSIFSHSVSCLFFTFLIVSFDAQIFNFDVYFSLCCSYFGDHFKESVKSKVDSISYLIIIIFIIIHIIDYCIAKFFIFFFFKLWNYDSTFISNLENTEQCYIEFHSILQLFFK